MSTFAAQLRDSAVGPWRAVIVLTVTQILAWGSIYYPVVLTAPLMAADHQWSMTFTMAGFSVSLLVAGIVSRHVGSLIDRYGGHSVMSAGSIMGALGLASLGCAQTAIHYFAAWALLGLAMAASLYDAAFATLGRIFGTAAARPIAMLTVAAGLTSTVSWPTTNMLLAEIGWRNTYLAYAAGLIACAAPLHWWALPRGSVAVAVRDGGDSGRAEPPALPPSGAPFVLVACGFATFSFIFSGLSAHLLAIFQRLGLDANIVVAAGALIGPSQIGTRLGAFVIARHAHPLVLVRTFLSLFLLAFALLAIFGISAPIAAIVAVTFGATNGFMTVAKATVPLALFGATGYGRLLGRIAGPGLLMQSAAPFTIAFLAERTSDPVGLAAVAGLGAVSLACFLLIKRPSA